MDGSNYGIIWHIISESTWRYWEETRKVTQENWRGDRHSYWLPLECSSEPLPLEIAWRQLHPWSRATELYPYRPVKQGYSSDEERKQGAVVPVLKFTALCNEDVWGSGRIAPLYWRIERRGRTKRQGNYWMKTGQNEIRREREKEDGYKKRSFRKNNWKRT
jgi:hypothetical protein